MLLTEDVFDGFFCFAFWHHLPTIRMVISRIITKWIG